MEVHVIRKLAKDKYTWKWEYNFILIKCILNKESSENWLILVKDKFDSGMLATGI